MPKFGESGIPMTPVENRAEQAIEYREAALEDVPAMLKFYQQAWVDTYVGKDGVTEEDGKAHFAPEKIEAIETRWRESFVNPQKNVRFFLATEANQIVGLVKARLRDANETHEAYNDLSLLYVRKDQKRRGVGKRLVVQAGQKCFDSKRPTMLSVAVSNTDARVFYEGLGFEDFRGPGDMNMTNEKKIPCNIMRRPPKEAS